MLVKVLTLPSLRVMVTTWRGSGPASGGVVTLATVPISRLNRRGQGSSIKQAIHPPFYLRSLLKLDANHTLRAHAGTAGFPAPAGGLPPPSHQATALLPVFT